MGGGPGRSEPLGADEGVSEVDEEPCGHEGAEREVERHGKPPSEACAERRVTGRRREEGEAGGEENDIEHGASVSVKWPRTSAAARDCARGPR